MIVCHEDLPPALARKVYGPLSNTASYNPGIGERIVDLFKSFGDFLSTGLVVLAGIVIYGIPVLFVLLVMFWLFFGKIGLLKKIWRLAAGKKKDTPANNQDKNTADAP
ncbi:MAG: hypothetical protein LBT16_02130 [Treponema sp.]|nr:hypothetical protein [Treponema sp.]